MKKIMMLGLLLSFTLQGCNGKVEPEPEEIIYTEIDQYKQTENANKKQTIIFLRHAHNFDV